MGRALRRVSPPPAPVRRRSARRGSGPSGRLAGARPRARVPRASPGSPRSGASRGRVPLRPRGRGREVAAVRRVEGRLPASSLGRKLATGPRRCRRRHPESARREAARAAARGGGGGRRVRARGAGSRPLPPASPPTPFARPVAGTGPGRGRLRSRPTPGERRRDARAAYARQARGAPGGFGPARAVRASRLLPGAAAARRRVAEGNPGPREEREVVAADVGRAPAGGRSPEGRRGRLAGAGSPLGAPSRPAERGGAGGGGTPAGPSGRFPHPRARYLASAPPRVRGAGRKERGAGPERAASPTPPSSPRAAEPGGGLKTRAARGARREVGGRGRSSARRRDAGMEERSPGGARRRAPPALSLPSPPAASAVAAPSVLRGAGPGRRGGHPVPPLRGLGLGRRARRARGRALAPAGLARVRSGPRRGSRPGARRSPRRCVPRPPRRARPAGRRAGRPARASRGAGGSAPPVRPACVRTPGLLPSLGASPPFPPSVASRVLSFVPAAVASHRAFALGLAGRAGRASGRSGVGRPAAGLRAEARGAGAAPESVPVPPAAVRASAAGAPPGRARGGGVGGRGAGEEGERRRGRFGARVSRTARKGPRSARAPSGGPARARAGGAAGAGGGLVCSRPRRSRRRRRRRSVAAAGLRPGRRAPSRGRPRLLRPGRAEPGAWSVPEARQGRFPRSGARAPRPSRSGRASLPAGRPAVAGFFFPSRIRYSCARTVSGGDARPPRGRPGVGAGRGRGPSAFGQGERERERSPRARGAVPKVRQLLAVDHSARASMKNAASCEN